LLQEFRQRFLDVCDGVHPKGGLLVMKDISLMKQGVVKGERLINKLQDLTGDDKFLKFIEHPEILDYAEAFVGKDMLAMHTMLINKPPDSGTLSSRHPLHQDLHYFPFRPAKRVICAWTAMEHVHSKNGCLILIPGSHRRTLQPHEYPNWGGAVNKMYHGIQDATLHDQTINVEMQAGDTVFFHPLLIHGSGANMTEGFRKAISCHYASGDCNYIETVGTTQEGIGKEIEAISKKRGYELTFMDVWKFRAHLVRGQRGNM